MRALSVPAVISAAVFAVAGCAGSVAPAKEASETEAAIRAADEVGAPRVPAASLHLKLARDQLHDAKALMAEGDNDSARVILARARLDAELAVAMAHSAEARTHAREMEEQLKTLEQQAR